MSQSKKTKIMSVFILIVFFVLWFLLFYFQEPLGDDTFIGFENSISPYIDTTIQLGNKITTFSQGIKEVMHRYEVWTGRVSSGFFVSTSEIYGFLGRAILGSLGFCAVVILFAQLIFKNISKTFEHPFSLFVLCSALFWSNYSMCYNIMWSMFCYYTLSILFYLIYFNVLQYIESVNYKLKTPYIIIFNILGLIAGLSHELIGLIFGSMILYNTLKLIIKKKINWKKIFFHSGLLVGYCFCFFAPGNFYRSTMPHEDALRTVPYFQRLLYSIKTHLYTAFFSTLESRIIFIFIFTVFVVSMIYKMKNSEKLATLKQFIASSDYLIVGAIVSVFGWSIVATVPIYAVTAWTAFVYLMFLQHIAINTENLFKKFNGLFAVVLTISLLVFNIPWLSEYISITQQRRSLIQQAVSNQKPEVKVPAYPENSQNHITFLDYKNQQKHFDTDYYIKYFGTHIIIDDQS